MRFASRRDSSSSTLAVMLLIAGALAPHRVAWAQIGQENILPFTVNAATEWNDTGVDLLPGDQLLVRSNPTAPQWTYATGGTLFGSSGDVASGIRPGTQLPSVTLGALIQRIGDRVMPVATGYVTVPRAGRLAFGMNDVSGTFSDNRGSLEVTVAYVQRPVKMPLVVGLTQAEALAQLKQYRIAPAIDQDFSNEHAAGVVSAQEPDPGTELHGVSTFRIVVSSGPQLIPVPDVVGATEASARAILGDGLNPNLGGSEISTQTPGTVTRTAPPAGAQVPLNSVVNYWVAEPQPIVVPNVIGMPAQDAAGVLLNSQLVPRNAGAETSTNTPGTVTRTLPTPGTQVEQGSVVRLWFAEPGHVIVPPVVGMPQANAAARLTNAKLRPIPAGADKSNNPPGTVTRTSPPPGINVLVDSGVMYWVAEPMPVNVPNVVGLSEKIAVQRLRQTPLRPKLAGADESENPQGTVTRIEPEAGRQVERESEVRYWVATTTTISVPPVRGLTPEEAERRLQTLRLQSNLGGKETSDSPPGTVTRTEPPENTPVAPGSEVKYWVAESEGSLVIVPDVIGLSSDSAVIQLKDKQLQPKLEGAEKSEYPAKSVTRTDPPAETQVQRHSEVKYWIAREKKFPWWLVGCGVLAALAAIAYFWPKPSPPPSPPPPEEPVVPPDFSAGFHLPPKAGIKFASEPKRELPDLTVSVVINPGEFEFLTPIPIEKIEVRHD